MISIFSPYVLFSLAFKVSASAGKICEEDFFLTKSLRVFNDNVC
jgi:hypothetical protein